MEINSSTITKNSLSLITNSPVIGLKLSYGKDLQNTYELNNINSSEIEITKEALGVDSLNNTYFKLHLFDIIDDLYVGLYNLDVINNKDKKDYDARDLKQELANFNYYHGIIQSLGQREKFQEANDFFFNYMEFLEKKLNGNNFIQNIERQGHIVAESK